MERKRDSGVPSLESSGDTTVSHLCVADLRQGVGPQKQNRVAELCIVEMDEKPRSAGTNKEAVFAMKLADETGVIEADAWGPKAAEVANIMNN